MDEIFCSTEHNHLTFDLYWSVMLSLWIVLLTCVLHIQTPLLALLLDKQRLDGLLCSMYFVFCFTHA